MNHLYWFFHLLGLAVWLGSILTLAVSTILLRKNVLRDEGRAGVQRLLSVMSIVGNSGAAVMLISGGLMLSTIESNHGHPLWIQLMTEIGGSTIIFSVIAVTWQSRRLSACSPETDISSRWLQRNMGLLQLFLWIVTACIVVVLALVSFRV